MLPSALTGVPNSEALAPPTALTVALSVTVRFPRMPVPPMPLVVPAPPVPPVAVSVAAPVTVTPPLIPSPPWPPVPQSVDPASPPVALSVAAPVTVTLPLIPAPPWPPDPSDPPAPPVTVSVAVPMTAILPLIPVPPLPPAIKLELPMPPVRELFAITFKVTVPLGTVKAVAPSCAAADAAGTSIVTPLRFSVTPEALTKMR